MLYTLHILRTQKLWMPCIPILVISMGLGWTTANAQHTNFTLQVVEFNKVDIRPVLCSPHVSVEPIETTAASVTGSDNEAVLRWISGGEAKKITIEGKQLQPASSLHVIVRPVTENVSIFKPAVAVGQDKVRDLLVGNRANLKLGLCFLIRVCAGLPQRARWLFTQSWAASYVICNQADSKRDWCW